MSSDVSAELRAVVAQVVRDVVAEVAHGATPRPAVSSTPGPEPSGPAQGASRSSVETVRITGNADLQDFTHRLLRLFENPKAREDVRTGRLKFELAGGVAAATAPGVVERIEQGAVTERKVIAAAAAGSSLLLGRRAVLTPLAREKARTLGVPVEKER